MNLNCCVKNMGNGPQQDTSETSEDKPELPV
jgi:hypothetical protein